MHLRLGYSGSDCSSTCRVALGLACGGRGICQPSGLCECFADDLRGFWTLDNCTACAFGYGGGNCEVACPTGLDGLVCSGHGDCDADGSCLCVSGAAGHWEGTTCDRCQSGWYGSRCDRECPGGPCNPCSSHGTCSDGISGIGTCRCDALWAGTADCSGCSAGSYGTECELDCPMDVNGVVCGLYGTCSDGRTGTGDCTCDEGFVTNAVTGACDNCAAGHYGGSCSPCPTVSGTICGGHGQCSEGLNGNGDCACDAGYGGPLCTWYCGASNNRTCGRGTCTAPQTCVCEDYFVHNAAGVCDTCDEGLYGVDCTESCVGCANGRCDVTGACVCAAGYWGDGCVNECPGGAENACAGHGTCDGATGVCTCSGHFVGTQCNRCHPSWRSLGCAVQCPLGQSGTACSGRGMCLEGQCYSCSPSPVTDNNTVVLVCGSACELTNEACGSGCPPGFYGAQCEMACPGTPIGCSSHGVCRTDGTCLCYNGFEGTDCSSACPCSAACPATATGCAATVPASASQATGGDVREHVPGRLADAV